MQTSTPSRAFRIGLPLVLVGAAAMTARAFDTSWIAPGQTLSADKLKTNLDETQSRLAALEADPDCPRGYMVSAKPYVAANPDSVQCTKGSDILVKVGYGQSAFWIDQYEASIWSSRTAGTQYGLADNDAHNANFPRNGQWTTPMYARSAAGVTPSRFVTWFQANEACRLGGKRLATGDEWLTAAGGTPDTGANNGNASGSHGCNTLSTGPRATGGGAGGCVSRWGAEDMIGNVWEWTAEWYAAAGRAADMNGSGASLVNDPASAWPSDYGTVGASGGNGADHTNNMNTWTSRDEGDTRVTGLPAGTLRGGSWGDGNGAGVFAQSLDYAPSVWAISIGFRCVVR